MRKRILLIFASLLFALGVFVGNTFAQEESQVIDSGSEIAPDFIPPYPGRDPGFLGQDHNYSVVFRGNGEAIVSLKVAFFNNGEDELSSIDLRIPRVDPRELVVYQVIRERECVRYDPTVYDSVTRTYLPQVCAEYQSPNYFQPYYSGAKYQKAEYELDVDTLKVSLPNKVAPNKSGSYFIFYRAGGYTTKNIFQAYKYDFETLKVNDDIRSLNVAIDVDSDLVLRGGQGEVQYRFSDVAESTFKGVGGAAPMASGAIDTFYSNIGYGRIIKNATNLSPLESYTVTGSFATNRLKLFAKEILIGVVIVVFALALLTFVFRIVVKKLKNLDSKEKEVKKSEAVSQKGTLLAISGGVGFVSALLISGYTTLVILMGTFISRSVSYQYNTIFVLFLLLISFGVYGLLLFGPAIYLGVKRGAEWGIATAVSTIVWMIIFLAISLLVIFLIGETGSYGPIVPLLEGFAK